MENIVFILSAKCGILKSDEIIEPYNETLNTKTREEQRKWAEKVLHQIKKECDINLDTFIFLAGKKYYRDLVLIWLIFFTTVFRTLKTSITAMLPIY